MEQELELSMWKTLLDALKAVPKEYRSQHWDALFDEAMSKKWNLQEDLYGTCGICGDPLASFEDYGVCRPCMLDYQ